MKITLAILIVYFSITFTAVLWNHQYQSQNLRNATLLQYASQYTAALGVFRTRYTSEVVTKAKAFGMNVTHDYIGKPEAIPLPATLSMDIGNKLGERQEGILTRLYSRYPFPWRKDGGVRDRFEEEAVEFLKQSPKIPYYQFNELKGKKVLRYAVSDSMRPACVSCHNTHPESPKTDWKVGDVRGILEIIIPLELAEQQTMTGLWETTILMGVTILLGGSLILFSFRKVFISEENLKTANMQLMEQKQNLEDRQLEIQEKNRELEVAQTGLIERTQALERANRHKSEFLANMSHELRTPLTGIIGFANRGMVNFENIDNKKLLKYFTKIKNSGDRLHRLLSDLLDLSKLEAGKMDYEMKPGNLMKLLKEVSDEMEGVLQERDIDLVILPFNVRDNIQESIYIGESSMESIYFDKEKISQVVRNFLTNAIKFTPSQKKITLSMAQDEMLGGQRCSDEKKVAAVRVTVMNEGNAIPEDELESIFEKFIQSSATKTSAGGTGLGLPICKQIIDDHLGKIWAENSENGPCFHFSLRKEKPICIREEK